MVQLGYWYSHVRPDAVRAFVWYSLAVSNGHQSVVLNRDIVEKKMTPAQIAEAERLVREWKPDPEGCAAEAKASG